MQRLKDLEGFSTHNPYGNNYCGVQIAPYYHTGNKVVLWDVLVMIQNGKAVEEIALHFNVSCALIRNIMEAAKTTIAGERYLKELRR